MDLCLRLERYLSPVDNEQTAPVDNEQTAPNHKKVIFLYAFAVELYNVTAITNIRTTIPE